MTWAVTSRRPLNAGDYAFDWALVDVETSGLRPHQDRVMVAHNAQFDYDFLAHEFAQARLWLPVTQRLCTLALNRRVGPPTDDQRLGTLAAHYRVRQVRAHDALDDVRVLSGILRGSLDAAARLDLPLPLVPCPPRQGTHGTHIALNPPKPPCAFRNPGRMPQNGPLQQGMKVAITGGTAVSRPKLVAGAVSACLSGNSSPPRSNRHLPLRQQTREQPMWLLPPGPAAARRRKSP